MTIGDPKWYEKQFAADRIFEATTAERLTRASQLTEETVKILWENEILRKQIQDADKELALTRLESKKAREGLHDERARRAIAEKRVKIFEALIVELTGDGIMLEEALERLERKFDNAERRRLMWDESMKCSPLTTNTPLTYVNVNSTTATSTSTSFPFIDGV